LETLVRQSGDAIASHLIGQYMRPSPDHLPVQKYWHPDEFDHLGAMIAREMGGILYRSVSPRPSSQFLSR
jgi:lipoate synthase